VLAVSIAQPRQRGRQFGQIDPKILVTSSVIRYPSYDGLGIPALLEYLVFPGAGHGLRNRENRMTASDPYQHSWTISRP
jgi:hypothetical protein